MCFRKFPLAFLYHFKSWKEMSNEPELVFFSKFLWNQMKWHFLIYQLFVDDFTTIKFERSSFTKILQSLYCWSCWIKVWSLAWRFIKSFLNVLHPTDTYFLLIAATKPQWISVGFLSLVYKNHAESSVWVSGRTKTLKNVSTSSGINYH